MTDTPTDSDQADELPASYPVFFPRSGRVGGKHTRYRWEFKDPRRYESVDDLEAQLVRLTEAEKMLAEEQKSLGTLWFAIVGWIFVMTGWLPTVTGWLGSSKQDAGWLDLVGRMVLAIVFGAIALAILAALITGMRARRDSDARRLVDVRLAYSAAKDAMKAGSSETGPSKAAPGQSLGGH